jgi:hypothetical protein
MNHQFFYAEQMMADEVGYYALHLYTTENHFHVVLNRHLLNYMLSVICFFLVISLNNHDIFHEN